MMTTDTRPVVHETWCNDHSAPTPGEPESRDLCSWDKRITGSHFVDVEQGEDGGSPYVAAWGNGDPLTPAQARTMAAALVEAAALAEGRTATTAAVLRNLTAAVAGLGDPSPDDVERLSDVLGANVVQVFTA